MCYLRFDLHDGNGRMFRIYQQLLASIFGDAEETFPIRGGFTVRQMCTESSPGCFDGFKP